MGDEEQEDIQEDQDNDFSSSVGGGGGSKLVKILMYVGGSIFILILMVLISYFIAKKVKSDSYKEEQNIIIAPAPKPQATYTFQKEFRVNTADLDEPHFIQMSLAFAYDGENKKLETELIQRQIQMMHIINIILRGKKKEDLSTPLQVLNLAEEIKSQINQILRDGKIAEVFFKEIIVS